MVPKHGCFHPIGGDARHHETALGMPQLVGIRGNPYLFSLSRFEGDAIPVGIRLQRRKNYLFGQQFNVRHIAASAHGLVADIAAELQERAHNYLVEQEESNTARRRELGVTDDLAEVEGVTSAMQVALGEAGVKTRDDLADLASDELIDPEEGVLRGFRSRIWEDDGSGEFAEIHTRIEREGAFRA